MIAVQVIVAFLMGLPFGMGIGIPIGRREPCPRTHVDENT